MRHGFFNTDIEIDTCIGLICLRARVEHEDGAVISITPEGRTTINVAGWDDQADPASPMLARAAWPMLVRKIREAHEDDLAESLPRYDDRTAYRTVHATV